MRGSDFVSVFSRSKTSLFLREGQNVSMHSFQEGDPGSRVFPQKFPPPLCAQGTLVLFPREVRFVLKSIPYLVSLRKSWALPPPPFPLTPHSDLGVELFRFRLVRRAPSS